MARTAAGERAEKGDMEGRAEMVGRGQGAICHQNAWTSAGFGCPPAFSDPVADRLGHALALRRLLHLSPKPTTPATLSDSGIATIFCIPVTLTICPTKYPTPQPSRPSPTPTCYIHASTPPDSSLSHVLASNLSLVIPPPHFPRQLPVPQL